MMSKPLLSESAEAKQMVAKLFESDPPLLIEVRFPGGGTSPDWYLCQEEEQLQELLQRLGPGAELHVSSVWNLRDVKGAIRLKE